MGFQGQLDYCRIEMRFGQLLLGDAFWVNWTIVELKYDSHYVKYKSALLGQLDYCRIEIRQLTYQRNMNIRGQLDYCRIEIYQDNTNIRKDIRVNWTIVELKFSSASGQQAKSYRGQLDYCRIEIAIRRTGIYSIYGVNWTIVELKSGKTSFAGQNYEGLIGLLQN
ncbi:MAG: hypothetical protein EZS28_031788 [Streblomastix strix]|uniref:Uncharacterized protein n=1 Tax=Streblomastix strix TaxID=222440 RepID=A0A5J4UR78_9EUKA|nr:MAG: hypothetical protein EZS28_031788 [Streblomastix strix]